MNTPQLEQIAHANGFNGVNHFIEYLDCTLIPDLLSDEREATARDFQVAVELLKASAAMLAALPSPHKP